MSEADQEALADKIVARLKADGAIGCCGGLAPEEIKIVKGWTKNKKLSKDEWELLQDFLTALKKGKKWIGIIMAAIILLLAKDIWKLVKVAGKAIGQYIANGG